MPETTIGPSHLCDLARQVRQCTLDLLSGASDSELLWAPRGTSNHILWHAGHALWLQGRLCLEPLTGRTELPAGWEDTFGMDCRPVASTKSWPGRKELADLLARQLGRIDAVLKATPIQRLAIPSSQDGFTRSLAGTIIHGLHDEARHQGEMYLLLKLARSRQHN
jgi:hypothetical protein